MMKVIPGYPWILSGGGLYTENLDKLRKSLTFKGKYGDPFTLYEDVEDGVLVPRNLCKVCPATEIMIDPGEDVGFFSKFKPRDSEQARVVDESTKLLLEGYSFITKAPTGFGKTACAMDVIANVGKRTLIVVTKSDLADQWIDAAEKFLGIPADRVGLLSGSLYPDKDHKIVISMIQSLSRKGKYIGHDSKYLDGFGLVIFDEVHRVGADQFNRACYKVPAARRWGLSATPAREDGKDYVLEAHIGLIRVSTSKVNLTPKVISKVSSWKVPRVVRNGELVKLPHDFGKTMHVEKGLASNSRRNLMIANFVLQAYKKGRNIIVFSALTDHLVRLEQILTETGEEGIPVEDIAFYWGGISAEEREAAKKKPIILATYAYTAEATDIPQLDTAVLATPRGNVVQIVGRILRKHDGKRDPVVFDIADMDSPVFAAYAKKRIKWYRSVGAKIVTK